MKKNKMNKNFFNIIMILSIILFLLLISFIIYVVIYSFVEGGTVCKLTHSMNGFWGSDCYKVYGIEAIFPNILDIFEKLYGY